MLPGHSKIPVSDNELRAACMGVCAKTAKDAGAETHEETKADTPGTAGKKNGRSGIWPEQVTPSSSGPPQTVLRSPEKMSRVDKNEEGGVRGGRKTLSAPPLPLSPSPADKNERGTVLP